MRLEHYRFIYEKNYRDIMREAYLDKAPLPDDYWATRLRRHFAPVATKQTNPSGTRNIYYPSPRSRCLRH